MMSAWQTGRCAPDTSMRWYRCCCRRCRRCRCLCALLKLHLHFTSAVRCRFRGSCTTIRPQTRPRTRRQLRLVAGHDRGRHFRHDVRGEGVTAGPAPPRRIHIWFSWWRMGRRCAIGSPSPSWTASGATTASATARLERRITSSVPDRAGLSCRAKPESRNASTRPEPAGRAKRRTVAGIQRKAAKIQLCDSARLLKLTLNFRQA